MPGAGVMKGASSRYWKIYRINPTRTHNGYEHSAVSAAQAFLQQSISESEDIQSALLARFYASASDIKSRAYAGLCLRCFVSEPILKACKKIHNLFASDKSFTYQELLGFVLNDDGQSLVITDDDRKAQLVVNSEGKTDTAKYQFFTVKVLQTFKSDLRVRLSLENWAYLQTKQNPEVKDFLSEFGFKNLSDWALLNRVRPKQIERLSKQDANLVEVFHCCYRRDRIQQRKQNRSGGAKCPDPSECQLQEMLALLQKRGNSAVINNTKQLLKALKYVAIQLRQYDIWSYRESLEVQDLETGSYVTRTDLAYDSTSEVDVEQNEILEFLHSQLEITLINSIEQEVESSILRLQKSKKYAPFAAKFIPGLQLYYQEGKSLKEITDILQMSSWDQARRVFNPGELLAKVRSKTVEQLLDNILNKACELGLTTLPPAPDYLKTLAEQIELFADEEVFQSAAEEIRAGKNRVMNSRYAHFLCQNLQLASVISVAS